MEQKPKAVLEPSGRIVLTGEGLTEFLTEVKMVELWQSPADRGLALRFLPEATEAARPVSPGDQPDQAVIEAGEFLVKVGFGLPENDHELVVEMVDDERKIITLHLEAQSQQKKRFAPGEVLAGLEE